jgi:hypothetical protein
MNKSSKILFGSVAALLTIMAIGARARPNFSGAATVSGCTGCHSRPSGSFNVLPSSLIEMVTGGTSQVTFDVTQLGSAGDASSIAVYGLNTPNLMATPVLTGWSQRTDGAAVYVNPFFNTVGQRVLQLSIGAGATLGDYSINAVLGGGSEDWSTVRSFTIRLRAPGIPGDYNGNGVVEAADYVAWRKNPANFGGTPAGYNTWRANFGRTAGSGSASRGAIPEPGTGVLAAFLVAALVFRSARARK